MVHQGANMIILIPVLASFWKKEGFLLKLGPVVFVLNYIFTNIEQIGSGSQTLLHVT